MATYTPKPLIGPAAPLTSTPTVYASTAPETGVVRTISVTAKAGSITFTLAFGADAAATRLFDAQPLVANQAYVQNGWWVTAANSAHALDMTSNATGNNCIANVSGYGYA